MNDTQIAWTNKTSNPFRVEEQRKNYVRKKVKEID